MKLNTAKIKMILAEQEMTRGELADICGICRQNVSVILNRGTCEPKTAGKIAKGLGVSVAEIVKEE